MKFMQYSLALLALVWAFPASAHYLWIEPFVEEARLYFGEYQEALRERVGGRLDEIAAPQAWTHPAEGKPAALVLERKEDHFALQASASAPLIAQEAGMPVKDLRKHNIGIVKPMYYARFSTGGMEAASALDLDIQPLGNNRVRVSLHGKPLVKAKLTVYAPNLWMREYETGDAGEITVEMPCPGLYVLQVAHVEPAQGAYQGQAYEGIRHVGALSLIR